MAEIGFGFDNRMLVHPQSSAMPPAKPSGASQVSSGKSDSHDPPQLGRMKATTPILLKASFGQLFLDQNLPNREAEKR